MVAQAPPQFPQIATLGIGMPVLLFTLGISIACALVFGALPAVRAGRTAAGEIVREGGKGAVGMRAGGRLSAALVSLEIALAIVLVVSSGLMLRSVLNLYEVDPGLNADGVLVLRPNPPHARYRDTAAFQRFYDDIVTQIEAVPGVESAAGIQLMPVTFGNWDFPMYLQDHEVRTGATPPSHNFRLVTPGYFETMRIPLLQGRTIAPEDRARGQRVVVINRAFAERYWPGEDPVGKHIRVFTPAGEPLSVIGVVGDVRQAALHIEPQPELYMPHSQWAWKASLWILVRAQGGDASSLASSIRDAVWSIDPQVPVSQMEPLERVIDRSAGTSRFLAVLLAVFGALALLLGAVGVYGVTAFTVARRLPEFGLRVALGARGKHVLRSALGRGLAPIALGVALGMAGALAGTRLLRNLLFGVSPTDPLTFAVVTGLLGLIAVGALLPPAWRATHVDPLSVLRRE
jgi:predicted permease